MKEFIFLLGLDYVAHEDIIPYASTEKQPIAHELFDKFLMYDPDKGIFFLSAFDAVYIGYCVFHSVTVYNLARV